MPILCYHAIDDDWESALAVRPRDFARQCDWLSRHRHLVDIETAAAAMDRNGRLPSGMVALTFDDGFADNYQHALPIIRRLGIPAALFVVAETVRHGQEVDWVDDPPSGGLEVLDRDQILEMAEAGFTIGSHSLRHRILPDLSPDECEADLRESRLVLEDLLERPVTHLAYPRGMHGETVRKAAARAGYAWSFSLPQASEKVEAHAIPRVGIFRDNGPLRFRAKLSERYLAMRTSKVHAAVRRS